MSYLFNRNCDLLQKPFSSCIFPVSALVLVHNYSYSSAILFPEPAYLFCQHQDMSWCSSKDTWALGMRLSLIGDLQDPVTWYGINYTGTQMTQWDFQNKGTRTSPARLSFVLKVPLRHLRPSVIYSVPCDRILQMAYWQVQCLLSQTHSTLKFLHWDWFLKRRNGYKVTPKLESGILP